MAKEEPKEADLEQELDSLYRKVSSRDQSEDNFHPPQQLKTQTAVPEEPMLHTGGEKRPLQRGEVRRFRASRIVFLLLPALILSLVTIFFWPVIYHYDALNFEGKVYPLRINRLTGEAAYFDGAEWLRPPIPAEVKAPVPEKEIAQPAAVPPPETNQVRPPAPEPQAEASPPKTQGNLTFAIQIKAFPENRKEAAEKFVEGVKKNLPDVRMETVRIRGRGIWHRILLGHFSTREEASGYLKDTGISHVFRDSFVQRKSPSES